MSSSSSTSPTTNPRDKKITIRAITLGQIILGAIVLTIAFYLYVYFKPDVIMILSILVGWLFFRSFVTNYHLRKLYRRVKFLEQWK